MHRIGISFLLSLVFLASAPLLPAQSDPGAREDEKAARQKLLRASDQIDALQATVDGQTTQIADMKMTIGQQRNDIESLRGQLAALKEENASLRAALAKLDAARAEERKALLDEISKIVADGGKKVSAPAPTPTPSTPPTPAADGGEQKGFDYVVVKGDTLHAIATAYQANGVHVTVADIRAANNLKKDEAIHVGQKLFIPKK